MISSINSSTLSILKIALTSLALVLCAFSAFNERHIHFHHGDMRRVIDQAISEDKMIFVDVYASWCTSCKLMEESTFRAEKVVHLINAHYVPVMINVESLEGELFAAQEHITTLPALLVLNKEGKKLTQVNHALQTEGMLQLLKKHLK